MPTEAHTMPIKVSMELRQWLQDHGLGGYIKVAEAPPHPNALDIGMKINIDRLTNA